MSIKPLTSTRHLVWDACLNIRDLGGYPTQAGKETRWRAILRGDNLCRLTRQGIQAILDYGVSTIIDLRTPGELVNALHPFSIRNAPENYPQYLHLSVLQDKRKAAMTALEKTKSSEEAYPLILDLFKENIGAILKVIAQADPGPVLFHCHAGKDRTGLIAALILSLAGVPEDLIAADYAESNRYLEPLYQEILDGESKDPDERQKLYVSMLARPEAMLFTLAYLNGKYGSIPAYLRAAGVSNEEQANIRARIVEQ
ncbi:MAG TPA: tyrosine-protein phosphatase [Anaerolineaceae bacterium]|nr:tyrosine-protein phosphatase [Anaerolineaceae bacterium]